ncbi:myosin-VIIa-like isoform X2 [Babylonia areolata]|uniref:myosin-VIIa-like isoform X2 n=1 Tax=Babylonia areolata TaxID=304850 RepID=UPI003FD17CFD
MSQKSGRTERADSVAITVTQSAAAAFGEDIADDAYSVSELSHVEDEKRAKRVKGHPALAAAGESSRDAFLRTTISRGRAGGLESFAEDSTATTPTSGSSSPQSSGPNDLTSDASKEPSPNGSGNDANSGSGINANSGSGNDANSGSGNDAQSGSGSGAFDNDLESPSESSFAHFAKTRFYMKGTTHAYCCAALPHPLLPKEDRGDYLASLASWVLILRIMGDLPDRDASEILTVAGEHPPVITTVRANFKTKYTKKDVEDTQTKYSELFKDPIGTDMKGVPFLPQHCDSMLEKVQYVTALGIYRPDLRDELLCQVCKQLTNNPSRNSSVRGWVLLTLLAGSFAPSEKFAAGFKGFLQEGPSEFSQKVDRLMRRTCAVGTRGYPPSWLEFQACKNNKPLLVPVTFMNGFRTLCEVDSASTVQELVNNIGEKIGLKDPIGYSIYVTLHTKISCLGHGNHRVMDAISECEQHTKLMGLRESSSLWRLYFRREYFTPWVSREDDHVNTDLIYEQITRGVVLGEYKCEKEEVLILIAAQKFYIEYSGDSKLEKLDHFVRNWLTSDMKKKHEPSYFVGKVRESLQNNFLQTRPDPHSLKTDIVLFARDKWYLQFSRFYDAPRVQGPGGSPPLSKVVVAVNSKGVYILDDSDTIRLHLGLWELTSVIKGRHSTTIRTLKGDDYVITTSHSEDFYATLTSFIHGLRMRSRFAVVTQNTTQQEGASNVTVARGDLFVLNKAFCDTLDEEYVQGMCKKGACRLPRDKLFILATAVKPTADMMSGVMSQLKRDPTSLSNETCDRPRNLQLYSRQHFRLTSENAVTKLFSKASFKRDKNEALWQFSRDPLKRALLRRTCAKEHLAGPACRAFAAIQQYMGDLTLRQEVTDMELANDFILDPARRNKHLRDEIFCQIIKQLTNNPDKLSEEKGWILMTLQCATAAPSGELFDQCLGFLQGSKHRQARACVDFLNAQKTGGSRLFPPHALEHEMMTKQQPNVRVQVMVPSGTPVTLEVGCRTRVSDIKRQMKKRLRLHSIAEYSLFLSGTDTMHCLPDRAFYFDCLFHAETYWQKPRGDNNGGASSAASSAPSLVMLKKIWVNVNPGVDPEADKYFHFPQEVPNFVRGYHQSSDEEVVQLSALLYRSRFGQDDSHFKRFSEVAPMLLPRGFSDSSSLEGIAKEVKEEFQRSEGISQEEARTRFLRVAITWPTYGSVFFEVKQRLSKTLPKYCLVAINTSGVHISDLQTKEVKQTYEFSQIPNWAYDDSSFTLIISGPSGSSRVLLETAVGHNMDDVLMAHIAWVMETQMKRKHGFYNNVGESFC